MMETLSNVVGQVILGWLLADLLGGIVHWWEDRLARTDWPIIGPAVVVPNRQHHVDQLAFTKGTLLGRNEPTWLAVVVISVVLLHVTGPSPFWAAATVGGIMVNEVHRWAHLPTQAPRLVQVLQRTGIIQSPKQHALHHRKDSAKAYCILTDWLNPILDELHVWAALERLLTLAHLAPNCGTK